MEIVVISGTGLIARRSIAMLPHFFRKSVMDPEVSASISWYHQCLTIDDFIGNIGP